MRKLILAGAAALSMTVAMPHMALAQAADGPSPERLALAKRYVAAMHINQMISGMMHQMTPMMIQQMQKAQPGLTDAQTRDMSDAVTASMDEYMPKMTEAMIPVYAETFSTEELTKLDEFYESPIGQSILAKTPQAMQKMMPIMMQMMPEMQADMKKRICEKIDCTAKKAG